MAWLSGASFFDSMDVCRGQSMPLLVWVAGEQADWLAMAFSWLGMG